MDDTKDIVILFLIGIFAVIALYFGFTTFLRKTIHIKSAPPNHEMLQMQRQQKDLMRNVKRKQQDHMRNQKQRIRDMQRSN